MKLYYLLEHGDEIQEGDEIWNYIFMEWQPLRGGWIGQPCDTKSAKNNQPIRRGVTVVEQVA